jgi:hypothetical protein
MGQRNFAVLSGFVLDPRISFQNKNAYQGLFCVPLPWFLLTSGLVIPGVLYLICQLTWHEASFNLIENVRLHPSQGFAIISGLTLIAHLNQLWKKSA